MACLPVDSFLDYDLRLGQKLVDADKQHPLEQHSQNARIFYAIIVTIQPLPSAPS